MELAFPNVVSGERFDLLVIAGEHSGDEHAASMVADAKKKDTTLRVAGVGGPELRKVCDVFLFDLVEFSVVGFVEVLRSLKDQIKIRDEILRWVEVVRPGAVCFVDYPGLNLRIAKALCDRGIARKVGGNVSLLYYISPQVWAWKPKRKFMMAKMLDSLAVIFPFEVECFEGTGLDVRFVGHPFMSEDYELSIGYDPSGPVLLLPGSRHAMVKRIAPVLFSAFEEQLKKKQKLSAVCLYASESIRDVLEAVMREYPRLTGHVNVVSSRTHIDASSVLVTSGTMSLKCALASVPGAIVYRMHPISYWVARFFVRVPYIGIANLLLNKPLYPEFIQGEATKTRLGVELVHCSEDVERIKNTRRLSSALRELLDQPGQISVAQWLLEQLGESAVSDD